MAYSSEDDNEAPESISLAASKQAALHQQAAIRETLKVQKDARKQRLRELALKAMPSLSLKKKTREAEEEQESSPIVRRTFRVEEKENDVSEEETEHDFIRLDGLKMEKLVPANLLGWKHRLLMEQRRRVEVWRDRAQRPSTRLRK